METALEGSRKSLLECVSTNFSSKFAAPIVLLKAPALFLITATVLVITSLSALAANEAAQKVTDASCDDLIKLGFLTSLGTRETTTSVETVAKLKSAMPKTDVFK